MHIFQSVKIKLNLSILRGEYSRLVSLFWDKWHIFWDKSLLTGWLVLDKWLNKIFVQPWSYFVYCYLLIVVTVCDWLPAILCIHLSFRGWLRDLPNTNLTLKDSLLFAASVTNSEQYAWTADVTHSRRCENMAARVGFRTIENQLHS